MLIEGWENQIGLEGKELTRASEISCLDSKFKLSTVESGQIETVANVVTRMTIPS